MSQISPPIRILLAVAVAFLVAWMTVLKPKANPTPPAPAATPAGNVNTVAPATTGLGKAVEAAKGAAKATDQHSAAVDKATGGTGAATAPSTGTAATTGKSGAAAPVATSGELAGLPVPVAKAILHQKVLAIGFFSHKAADDRAVRRALAKVDRWDGRVFVTAAPLSKISRYGRIARGVDVQQSPTIVVVDRKLQATPLVGYVDTRTIDQAVVDALRGSGGLFTSGYLRDVHRTCTVADNSFFHMGEPSTVGDVPGQAKRVTARWNAWVRDFRSIPAPARFRTFKRTTLADAVAIGAVLSHFTDVAVGHPGLPRLVSAWRADRAKLAPPLKRLNKRMDSQHLLTCGTNG